MLTDREITVVLFKAVSALYAKLTGEQLSVSVETDEGVITVRGETVPPFRTPSEPPDGNVIPLVRQ